MKMLYGTYQATNEKNGRGTFFFTDCCGNRMYSVENDYKLYHGKLCPKCLCNGKQVTLYMRGTEEANYVMKNDQSSMSIGEYFDILTMEKTC